eukprot:g74161.t1
MAEEEKGLVMTASRRGFFTLWNPFSKDELAAPGTSNGADPKPESSSQSNTPSENSKSQSQPSADTASTNVFTYNHFAMKMKRPEAVDLLRALKGFVRKQNSKTEPVTAQEVADVHAFIIATHNNIHKHPLWTQASPQELENAYEGLEKYVMTKLYDRLFASDAKEIGLDCQLQEKMESLQFIQPAHLDIAASYSGSTGMWEDAMIELRKMDVFKSPRDKIVCLLNCCRLIMNVLKQVKQREEKAKWRRWERHHAAAQLAESFSATGESLLPANDLSAPSSPKNLPGPPGPPPATAAATSSTSSTFPSTSAAHSLTNTLLTPVLSLSHALLSPAATPRKNTAPIATSTSSDSLSDSLVSLEAEALSPLLSLSSPSLRQSSQSLEADSDQIERTSLEGPKPSNSSPTKQPANGQDNNGQDAGQATRSNKSKKAKRKPKSPRSDKTADSSPASSSEDESETNKEAAALAGAADASQALPESPGEAEAGEGSTGDTLPSADDFLPIFIYVIIKAKPSRLHLNIEYIQLTRSPARLQSEPLYFFTHLQSAVAFIRMISAESLTITPEEYEAHMKAYAERKAASAQNAKLSNGTKGRNGEDTTHVRDSEAKLRERERRERLREITRAHLDSLLTNREYGFVDKAIDDLRFSDIPHLLEEYKELAAVFISLQQAYRNPTSLLSGIALPPEEVPSSDQVQQTMVDMLDFTRKPKSPNQDKGESN